jgi:hypothetical protein
MNRSAATLLGTLALILVMPALAGPRDGLLGRYPAGSAERGKVLHNQSFAGGKPDTPACASCHGTDPFRPGRNPTGKAIEPVALSATPTRYADVTKVEKWFKRNCNEVMGRECTAQEKGDWLAYMVTR